MLLKKICLLCVLFLSACRTSPELPPPAFPVLNEKYDLWIYAKYVVTDDGILKNKYVGITREGKIGEISDKKPKKGQIIKGGRHILTPGFINAHDHLSYNHLGPFYHLLPDNESHLGERYNHRRDWNGGCRGYKKTRNIKTYRPELLIWNELRQVVSGTTSNVGMGGHRGFLRNFGNVSNEGLKIPKKIWNNTFPLKDNQGCKYLLEDGDEYPFHPKSADNAIFMFHIAEGKDAVARNEFVNISSNEGKRYDILGENVGLIHAVGLLEKDVKKIADSKATVIWSPRSNISLYGVTAPVSLMKDYGVNLALGTDWAYSGSVHILEELQVASEYNEKYLNNIFTAKELWQMVTVNPARLLQVSDQIGDIKTGMQADLALFYVGNKDFATDEEVYRAVIDMRTSKTDLVMRSGIILYGNWDLLKGIVSENPQDTDTFFGRKFYIGATADTGYSYQELLKVNKKARTYRLFPALKRKRTPTTVPMSLINRLYPDAPTYTGEITKADPDGDGIEKGDTDEKYFNPIRPVDLSDNDGKQTRARKEKDKK